MAKTIKREKRASMKYSGRRALSLFIVMLMLLQLAPFSVFAAQQDEYGQQKPLLAATSHGDPVFDVAATSTDSDFNTHDTGFSAYDADFSTRGADFSAQDTGFANSPYKHISYSGAPYNLDAITGATLTVEGPGVANSVPISIRELQETDDSNLFRGEYTDSKGARRYEGVRVLSILDGLVKESVTLLDEYVVVVFKNRWRQEVGRLSYDQIHRALNPVILAYGISDPGAGAEKISPFVFIGGAGADSALGNENGPLKLVYDRDGGGGFDSVAYMYIEEGVPPPGFKHIDAGDPAYNDAANTEFIMTFTGSGLGREVNYTVRELEEMESSLIHKDSYNLSNTTYWYVNEYEGIKLWDLLVKMGADETKKNDPDALVSFASWDNYQISAKFSYEQLSNPDLFYFYEKSPLDTGTDRPTKEQLATAAFHPTQRVGVWDVDDNGYPVMKGYPVMLAYGVNSYPYVRDVEMAGYKSGLGNSGGPMRLIYGKANGLNRDDPGALENYAYFFNNGSRQLQRVQEVYVGDSVRYSTHLENPDPAYQAMKDLPDALTVEIKAGGQSRTVSFTLAELESVLYGPGVSKRDRDNDRRQDKGYYAYGASGGVIFEDLLEGVNLEYLLTEKVGLQGNLGTVELYSGAGAGPSAVYDLSKIGEKGYNSMRGVSGLGMMVAFAKNGYPLVNSNTSPGYAGTDPRTGKTIQNQGGPLMFVRGQTAAERDGKTVTTSGETPASVNCLSKIVVNLQADDYAHIGGEYASRTILFDGAIAKAGGVSLSVAELETKQRYIVDDTYYVEGASAFYRGLDLYKLLNDKDIGASALMYEVIVKNPGGDSKTLSVNQLKLTAPGKRIILAYGGGVGAQAGPLDTAAGGPMRLIIDGGSSADCVSDVSGITVYASEISAWKHNFGVYERYAKNTLEISGQNLAREKTYTVAELEDMDNLIVQDVYKISNNSVIVQGIDLYKLLLSIGFAGGADSSVFAAQASDGYSPGAFTAGQLRDGINGKPILLAFGQGTNQSNGLPLVPDDKSEGYSGVIDNVGGPLRLLVHDNSGWSVKFLTKIIVGQAGSKPGFDFQSFQTGQNGFPAAGVRSISLDNAYGLWVGTYGGGLANLPQGAGSFTVYNQSSAPALLTPFTSGVAADKAGGVWFSQNHDPEIPSANGGAGYLKDGAITWYNTANSPIPDNYAQPIEIDVNGNVWFGTATGAARFDGDTWKTWTVADGLPALSVNTIAPDAAGGVWLGFYPDTVGTVSVQGTTAPAYRGGYAYIDAAGRIAFKRALDETNTTPYRFADFWVRGIAADNDGGAWIIRSAGANIGMPSSGGLADYVDKNGNITTYTGYELLGQSAFAGSPGQVIELRAVTVDKNGGLWFGTSGSGLYHLTEPGLVRAVYNTAGKAWPAGTPMDNIFVLKFFGDTLYVGSNGGIAWADVALAPPKVVVKVLDPPFTIRQIGKANTPWVIGGGGNTIKGLANNAGKLEKEYQFNGNAIRVRGAYLSDILAASGIGGDALISIDTTDGFSGPDYFGITVKDITDKAYFLAYDVFNPNTGLWDKVADIDKNNAQASLRIYREQDSGAAGQKNNEIKGLSGISVSVGAPLFRIEDRRSSDIQSYVVSDAMAQTAGIGAYQYTAVNRRGIPVRYSTSQGLSLTSLFDNMGINVNNDDLIRFAGNDAYATIDALWAYLSAPRRYYPNLPANLTQGQAPASASIGAMAVPLVIALDTNNGRVMFGQQAPHEQTSDLFAQQMLYNSAGVSGTIILTKGGGAGFPAITSVAPAAETLVDIGQKITINDWERLLGYTDGYIYYTTDGSEPTPASKLYNYETQQGAAGAVFKPEISAADSENNMVTLRIRVYGKGKLPGGITTFPYYLSGYVKPPANAGGDEPPPPVDGALALYDNKVKVREFSQADLERLVNRFNVEYSARNTYPNPDPHTDKSGVEIMTLLEAAGLYPADERTITFWAVDGYVTTLKVGDLKTPRYRFSGGSRAEVPAILSDSDPADGWRLFFGQLADQEQTSWAFIKKVNRIEIGGPAQTWGAVEADRVSGVRLSAGDLIRLGPIPEQNAKIYYTLDGAAPTLESDMYNPIGEQFLAMRGKTENDPIKAPTDGQFTLTTRIMGLGRNDGELTRYVYNRASGNPNLSISIGPGGSIVVQVFAGRMGPRPQVSFTADDLRDRIEEAVLDNASGVLELKVNAPADTLSVAVIVQAESIRQMTDSGLKSLVISGPLGALSYDAAALKSVYARGAGDRIEFYIGKVDVESLSEALQNIVGKNTLYQIKVTRNGTPVTDFGAGLATIRINYKLSAGESAFGVKVWHLSEDGLLSDVKSEYNSAQGYVQFSRNRHSYYMVGYDAQAALWKDNPFIDVKKDDWFYDAVRFVYERGLMTGTSTDPMLFSPNMTLSRGMVVTVLHRLAGSPGERIAAAAGGGQFYDVAEDKYYYQAINWAAANRIIAGYGGGRFGPDDNVTREQFAAILHNYSKWSGIDVSVGENTNILSYNDAFDVSEWAVPAMQWACGAGVIGGKPGGILDPRGSATRAEAAAMLERFINGVAER